MTTEIELLRKVAEAAERAAKGYILPEECVSRPGPLNVLASALAALRAHDAARRSASHERL